MGRLPLTGHNTRKDLDMTTWQTDVIDDVLESWSPEAIQLVNLTPHAITLMPVGGVTSTTIEPSGQVARVEDDITPIGTLYHATVSCVSPGRVVGLPDPAPNTLYLVSRITAMALPERRDLVFPLGEVRDGSGRILGVRGVARIAKGVER